MLDIVDDTLILSKSQSKGRHSACVHRAGSKQTVVLYVADESLNNYVSRP